MVREIKENELNELLELYLFLHEDCVPQTTEHLKNTWKTILEDKNHHIIVKEVNGKIVSSCVCVIIPNLTRNVRPYAFIENVVTHSDFRGKGYATLLIKNVQKYLSHNKHRIIYSHISKHNGPSLAVHNKCGFHIIKDYAVYSDGSVLQNCYTLAYEYKKCEI